MSAPGPDSQRALPSTSNSRLSPCDTEEFRHAGSWHPESAVQASSDHRDPGDLFAAQSPGQPMRRGFQSFKAKTIVRWLTAGKAVTASSLANNTDIGRDAARRIVKGVITQGSSIDRRQLGADILLLARAPDGVQQLEQAITPCGDGTAPLMVRALIYQVMADLACRADLFPRQAGVWSVFCLTALWSCAAVILVGAGLDPTLRLMWLVGLAAVLTSVGLAISGLVALWRRNVLDEVARIQLLVAGCEVFADGPMGGGF